MNTSWLPPLSLNVHSVATWPETIHPITSLLSAVYEFQEAIKEPTFSDLKLAGKIHHLSDQKIAYYNGRFGSILEFFSSLINYFFVGRFISAGRLGLELATPVIEKLKTKEREAELLRAQIEAEELEVERERLKVQEREAELLRPKKEMVATLQSHWPNSFEQTHFIDVLAAIIPFENISAWKKGASEEEGYRLELVNPVRGMIDLNGRPLFVSTGKSIPIEFFGPESKRTLSFSPGAVEFTTELSRLDWFSLMGPFGLLLPPDPMAHGWINSFTADQSTVTVSYTLAGFVESAVIPYSAFKETLEKGKWTFDPIVEKIETAAQPTVAEAVPPLVVETAPQPPNALEAAAAQPKELMEETFKSIWTKNSLNFVTRCWNHLLKGSDVSSWKQTGEDQYTLELAGKSTITPKPLKMGNELVSVPFYFEVEEKVKMNIKKDDMGLYSFDFPEGGFSSLMDIAAMRTFLSKISNFMKTADSEEKEIFLNDLNQLLPKRKGLEITESVLTDEAWKLNAALYAVSWTTSTITTPVEKITIGPGITQVKCTSLIPLVKPNIHLDFNTFLSLLNNFVGHNPQN